MIEANKKFWKGYVDFTGRSTRSDYWFAVLANILVIWAFGIITSIFIVANGGSMDGALGTIATVMILAMFVYCLAVILPFISIQVRRLRDAGYHWALIFLSLIPYLGGFIIFILTLQPTKVEVAFNNFNNPQQ
ncbi:MAG: DUF805 domain-containing protein [Streptococcus salivarius]|nr:DUF805 domain-containing protein [Streptococcus equinus]MBS5181834.1 DUF805 domain-containing protein [Streptococcus salivarius]MDU2933301.1 DUF805 domain-containing protein [Streptococcus salivarius]